MRPSTTLAIICTLVGCGDDSTQSPDVQPSSYTTVIEFPATPNRDIDLLFVVDDSPTMIEKQAKLAASLPAFVAQLEGAAGGLPNLHVGVISTDMGTKGSSVAMPGPDIDSSLPGACIGTGDDGVLQKWVSSISGLFLSDVEGAAGRERNYTEPLADTVRKMVEIGTSGCAFEQPLHALKRALENPMNAGFVRPEALLAIVFVTDEDDCSATTPALFGPESAELGPQQSFRCTRFGVTCADGGATPDEMSQAGTKLECAATVGSQFLDDVALYRDFLVNLKGDARKIVTASIMGPTHDIFVELRPPVSGGPAEPALGHSCSYQASQGLDAADPGVRLESFQSGFPTRHVSASICEELSPSISRVGDLVLQSLGSSCLGVTTIREGADCFVEDVAGTTVTRIDACGAAPCFEIVDAPDACATGTRKQVRVMRTGTVDPATITRLRCQM